MRHRVRDPQRCAVSSTRPGDAQRNTARPARLLAATFGCLLSTMLGAADDQAPNQSSAAVATTQPGGHQHEAVEEYWRFILETVEAAEKQPPKDAQQWWYDRLQECGTRGMAICCKSGAEPLAALFVEKFGRVSAAVDVLLLFGDVDLYPPLQDKLLSREFVESRSARARAAAEKMFEWMNAVARPQVIRFCADAEFFDRYYRACMWSQLPFGGSAPDSEYDPDNPERPYRPADPHPHFKIEYERLCEQFPRNESPEKPYYWWYARQFMFMAKATNSERMLEGVKPEEVYTRFDGWREWLAPHITYLLPHPEKPVWGVSPKLALQRRWPTQDYTVPDGPFLEWDSRIAPPDPVVLHSVRSVRYRIPEECEHIWPPCKASAPESQESQEDG